MVPSAFKTSVAHVNVKTGGEIIDATSDEIVIRGSGKVEIVGYLETSSVGDWPALELRVTLAEAVTESKVVLISSLVKGQMQDNALVWTLGK